MATSLSETDMHYVRSFEEAVYDHKLSELVASIIINNAHSVMEDGGLETNLSIALAMFR